MLAWIFLLFVPQAHAYQLKLITPPQSIYKILYAKSQKYSLDPIMFEAMIRCESGFNIKAMNKEGKKDHKAWSRGLGQVQYYTALEMGFKGTPEELFDPHINLEYAAKYLRQHLDQYGSYQKAISAYNAGTYYPRLKNSPHVQTVMGYAERRKAQWKKKPFQITSTEETQRLRADSN